METKLTDLRKLIANLQPDFRVHNKVIYLYSFRKEILHAETNAMENRMIQTEDNTHYDSCLCLYDSAITTTQFIKVAIPLLQLCPPRAVILYSGCLRPYTLFLSYLINQGK